MAGGFIIIMELCFPYDISLLHFNILYLISIFFVILTYIRKIVPKKRAGFNMLADPAGVAPGDYKKCSKNKKLAWQIYR